MAKLALKHRYVQTAFWEDPEVFEEFSPEDKFFYLYLMTNPHTQQAGIYQITVKHMSIETGYSQDSIMALIQRFEQVYKKIKYNRETHEMALKNWPKYNYTESIKTKICIRKELSRVKDASLLEFLGIDENGDFMNTPSMPHRCPIDDPSMTQGEKEKEKETKKEKEKETKESRADGDDLRKSLYDAASKSFHAGFERQTNLKRFSDYKKEGACLNTVVDRTLKLDLEDPRKFLHGMIKKYWDLIQGSDRYYRSKPFLPSSLCGDWDRVVVASRKDSEEDTSFVDNLNLGGTS